MISNKSANVSKLSKLPKVSKFSKVQIQNDHFYQSSFVHYCSRGMINEVKKYIKLGVNVSLWNEEPIKVASRFGKYEIVELLKSHGASIDVDNNYPIKIAVKNGHAKTVSLLVENGICVQFEDNFLIKNAAINGHFDLFVLLHKMGGNIGCICDVTISKINNNSNKFTEHDNIMYYINANLYKE